jgi:hypothetical protein
MNGTIEETKRADRSSKGPLFAWTALREFLLYTFALSGGFALIDLYAHGQSIWKYLPEGLFISAVLLLWRVRSQRILKSRTYLPPGN